MIDIETRLREQLPEIAGGVVVDASPSHRPRSQRLVAAMIGILVLALAGAIAWQRVETNSGGVSGPTPGKSPHTSTAVSVPPTSPSVVAVTAGAIAGAWLPVSIAGYSGSLTGPTLQITFEKSDSWGADDGCNGVGGSYRLGARGAIHLVVHAGTQALCPGNPPIVRALTAAARVELLDGRLTFVATRGSRLAQFERATAAAISRRAKSNLTFRAVELTTRPTNGHCPDPSTLFSAPAGTMFPDQAGQVCYLLGPVLLTGAGVASATANGNGLLPGWSVDLHWNTDAYFFAVAQPLANRRVALVDGGFVIAAPIVPPHSDSHDVVIGAGKYTQPKAVGIVATIMGIARSKVQLQGTY